MPAEDVVHQVFTSADFLLKRKQEKVQAIRSAAPAFRGIFLEGLRARDVKSLTYAAIDGTESVDSRLDFMIFYAGAFGYIGALKAGNDELLMEEERSFSGPTEISMAVPVHEGDVTDILQASEEDVSIFPSLLMELSELQLARQIMSIAAPKLLLLDRSISLEYAHLLKDSLELLGKGGTALFPEILAFWGTTTLPCIVPPPFISPQLDWALLESLGTKRWSSWKELSEQLGLSGMQDLVKEAAFALNDQTISRLGIPLLRDEFSLDGRFVGLEGQLESALSSVLEHLFSSREGHPLWVNGKWIRESELRMISFLTLRSLIGMALRSRSLIVGITKVSSSTDFMTGVLPSMERSGRLSRGSEGLGFGTDTTFLDAVAGALELKAPWRSVEFDAAYHGESVAPGIFARGYFKLSSSSLGRVFPYDRLLMSPPPHGSWVEGDGSWSGDGLSDSLFTMLQAMGHEAIPEAIGYNYPLFLADKKAKAAQVEARRAYQAAMGLKLAGLGLQSEEGYRDMRRYYERLRRSKGVV